MIKKNIWQLFWNTFQLQDEVILITDEDRFDYGKLDSVDEKGVYLCASYRHRHYYEWKVIRFMAHDGFPANKLMGADGSKSIEFNDSEITIGSIEELSREITGKECALENLIKDSKEIIRNCLENELATPTREFVVGDPFYITDVSAKIFNRGNIWIENEFWEEDNLYEETIYLKHKTGLIGLLWEISSIYYFK